MGWLALLGHRQHSLAPFATGFSHMALGASLRQLPCWTIVFIFQFLVNRNVYRKRLEQRGWQHCDTQDHVIHPSTPPCIQQAIHVLKSCVYTSLQSDVIPQHALHEKKSLLNSTLSGVKIKSQESTMTTKQESQESKGTSNKEHLLLLHSFRFLRH